MSVDSSDSDAKYAHAYAALKSSLPGPSVSVDRAECETKAAQLNGKVVLITGAGSGFGKAFAIKAAAAGAKVHISDISLLALQKTKREIKAAGGKAVIYPSSADVSNWDIQVDLFKHARNSFGHIDVVVPNAGIGEHGKLLKDDLTSDGELKKPDLLTLQVNFVGVAYTTKLAFYHLRQNPAKEGKAIVFLGSMASLAALPVGTVYNSAKHAVLGLFRSTYFNASVDGITSAIVCPWFADTAIIVPSNRIGLFGIPLCTVDDVVAAMLRCASDPTFHGNTVVVDAEGILALPFEATAPGNSGYFSEFTRRGFAAVKFERQVKDAGLIVLHLSRELFNSKLFLGGTALTAVGLAGYLQKKLSS